MNGVTLTGSGTTQISGILTLSTSTMTSLHTAVTQISGTITGAGNLSIGGAATWTSANGAGINGTGTANVVSGGTSTLPSGYIDNTSRPLTNDGTIMVNNANLGMDRNTTVLLTNESDGVINLVGASPNIYDVQSGTATFTNLGKLNSSATGTATISTPITNASSGTVSVQSGELLLSGSTHTNSGTVKVGDSSTASSLVVSGQYLQSAGTTTVALSSKLTSNGSTVAIEGGSLNGAGTVMSPVTTSGTGTVQNASEYRAP